jgi:hypothetical protein
MTKKQNNPSNYSNEEIILDLISNDSSPIEIQQEAGKRLQELLELLNPPINIEPIELSEKEQSMALANEEKRNEEFLRQRGVRNTELELLAKAEQEAQAKLEIAE